MATKQLSTPSVRFLVLCSRLLIRQPSLNNRLPFFELFFQFWPDVPL